MNQFLKWGGFLVAVSLSIQSMAQTFQTTTLLQRLVGGTLTTASNNIPVATNTNSITHVYAFPWTPIADNVPANGTNMVQFTAQGLPPTASNPVWTVQGDLVIQATSGFAARIANSNFTPRNGTNGTLLSNDRGQSKGRITLTYTYVAGDSGTCAGEVVIGTCSIDLIKKFAYTTTPTPTSNNFVSPIIGPTCLSPNTEYTFSVDETMVDNPNVPIGIDKYTWKLVGFTGANAPASAPLYTSSDLSSFTFKTGASVPASGAIRCYFGEANVDPAAPNTNDHAFSELRLIQATGVPVVTISGTGVTTGPISPSTSISSPSICIPTTAAGNGTLTFTVTQQPGVTYSWRFGTYNGNNPTNSNGWNTNPATLGNLPYTRTGTTLTIANIQNQPGTIVLTVTGPCGAPQEYTYHINRRHSIPGSITFSPTCLFPTGTSQATLAANASQNNLSWTSIPNFTFGPTGLITANNPAPGVYPVQVSFVGCTPSQTYNLNIKPANLTFTPNPLCIPRNGTAFPVTFSPAGTNQYSYTITNVGGTGNTLNGATLTTVAATNNTVSVQRTSTAPGGTLSATYTVAPGCFTTISPVPSISTAPVTPVVVAPPCVNGGVPGSTATLTISTHLGAGTYSVNYVSGAAVITPATNLTANGSNQITVQVSPTVIGIGTYTVTHTVPGCGTPQTSAPFTLDNATGRPTLNLQPAGANLVCLPSPILNYTYINCGTGTPLATNSANLANPVVLGSNPTGLWQFTIASGGTSVGIQATINGCIQRVCTTINYSGKPGRGLVEQFERKPGLPVAFGKIFPNPTDGEFEIEMYQAADKMGGRAVIFDAKGQVAKSLFLETGHNKISEKFAPGVYTVLTFIGGKEYYNRLVIK